MMSKQTEYCTNKNMSSSEKEKEQELKVEASSK